MAITQKQRSTKKQELKDLWKYGYSKEQEEQLNVALSFLKSYYERIDKIEEYYNLHQKFGLFLISADKNEYTREAAVKAIVAACNYLVNGFDNIGIFNTFTTSVERAAFIRKWNRFFEGKLSLERFDYNGKKAVRFALDNFSKELKILTDGQKMRFENAYLLLSQLYMMKSSLNHIKIELHREYNKKSPTLLLGRTAEEIVSSVTSRVKRIINTDLIMGKPAREYYAEKMMRSIEGYENGVEKIRNILFSEKSENEKNVLLKKEMQKLEGILKEMSDYLAELKFNNSVIGSALNLSDLVVIGSALKQMIAFGIKKASSKRAIGEMLKGMFKRIRNLRKATIAKGFGLAYSFNLGMLYFYDFLMKPYRNKVDQIISKNTELFKMLNKELEKEGVDVKKALNYLKGKPSNLSLEEKLIVSMIFTAIIFGSALISPRGFGTQHKLNVIRIKNKELSVKIEDAVRLIDDLIRIETTNDRDLLNRAKKALEKLDELIGEVEQEIKKADKEYAKELEEIWLILSSAKEKLESKLLNFSNFKEIKDIMGDEMEEYLLNKEKIKRFVSKEVGVGETSPIGNLNFNLQRLINLMEIGYNINISVNREARKLLKLAGHLFLYRVEESSSFFFLNAVTREEINKMFLFILENKEKFKKLFKIVFGEKSKEYTSLVNYIEILSSNTEVIKKLKNGEDIAIILAKRDVFVSSVEIRDIDKKKERFGTFLFVKEESLLSLKQSNPNVLFINPNSGEVKFLNEEKAKYTAKLKDSLASNKRDELLTVTGQIEGTMFKRPRYPEGYDGPKVKELEFYINGEKVTLKFRTMLYYKKGGVGRGQRGIFYIFELNKGGKSYLYIGIGGVERQKNDQPQYIRYYYEKVEKAMHELKKALESGEISIY